MEQNKEQEQKQDTFLETAPLGQLIKAYSLPCVISLLVAALYNIVDQIFIANASYLGSYGNAANSVVFPLTVIALAAAVMIGDGCCAFVSNRLGAGKTEDAGRGVGSAVIVTILSSVIITAVYLIFSEGILAAFGGRVNDETWKLAKEYFFVITLGIPFYMFGQSMNPIIRSDGSPRFAMLSTFAGAVLNIILDPLFIFTFHWGMIGAAAATIAGQILTCALAVWYLPRMRVVRLERSCFRLFPKLMKEYIPLGAASFFSQISTVVSLYVINNVVAKYSAADAVFSRSDLAQIPLAVVGIVMKFLQIIMNISVGLAAGCIPVVGYNLGAGHKDRVKALLTKLLTIETVIGVVTFIIVMAFPKTLIGIFGAANESIYYTEFAVRAFRTYFCLILFACINKMSFVFLQAMGKAAASSVISLLRDVVFCCGFALLLPRFFGLNGVLWSMPAADFLTFIIIALTLKKVCKSLEA